jgi:hypothetical protein
MTKALRITALAVLLFGVPTSVATLSAKAPQPINAAMCCTDPVCPPVCTLPK